MVDEGGEFLPADLESSEDESPSTSDFWQHFYLSRRKFLGSALAGLSATALAKLVPQASEVKDALEIGLLREKLNKERMFVPENPLEMLSREATDNLFETMNLGNEYSETLTKEAFHVIAQRPARLASLFLKNPDAGQEGFEKHCHEFFSSMKEHADYLGVDFVGSMLMFQISGDNTSSVRVQNRDLWDERVRVGLGLAHELVGEEGPVQAINLLRTLKVNAYYAMARLEGPVTVGIHDLEQIMIGRGVVHAMQHMDEGRQGETEAYFNERAKEYYPGLVEYVSVYDEYESVVDEITDMIGGVEMGEFVSLFEGEHAKKELMMDGAKVDGYQFLRTTVFWAKISELDQLHMVAGNKAERSVLEPKAMEETLAYYQAQDSAVGFVLDQLGNPKMIRKLRDFSESHPEIKEQVELVDRWMKLGDEIIFRDRDIAASMIKRDLEQDMQYQLFTGVAYTKWVLDMAKEHMSLDTKEAKFTSPDALAYAAFLGSGHRESGPAYLMAGMRPLNRATLPFARPELMHETIENFIGDVYSQFEDEHPEVDFQSFATLFFKLMLERYYSHSIGLPYYQLEQDERVGRFIKMAEEWGSDELVMTPPHNSWMRAFEATAGYITAMASLIGGEWGRV